MHLCRVLWRHRLLSYTANGESIQLLRFPMQVIFSTFCPRKSFNGRYLFFEDRSFSMFRSRKTFYFPQKILTGASFRCSFSLQFGRHWYFFSLTDGGWSKWSSWRSCSATCGGGFQMRTRSCDAPKPKYGGAQCKGSYYQTISCNTEDCPGNGGFLLKVGCPKLLHGC